MKKFIIIWLGELISNIGSGMTNFALGVYIYQMTGSVTAVSLFTLMAYLPTVLLHPIGGIMADRFDRRLMMILGDLLSAFGLVLILVFMQIGNITVGIIYIGVSISAIFISLLDPAYKASITDMLTEEEFAKASGLVQLAGSAKYLISPIIAGFLLAITDVRLILIIDIGTIFVTVFSIMFVRKTLDKVKSKKGDFHPFQELKEGWNALSSSKGLLILIGLMAFICFDIGFLQTLLSPMVLSFTDSKVLGIIESISAIGMLVGSVIIGVIGIKKNYINVLSLALLVTGVFMAGMGVSTNIYIIIGTGFIFFASLPFATASADTLARMKIPNEVQGRAWGLISVLSQIGYVIAYAVSGLLADYVFEPLLMSDGVLAESMGEIIGSGKGRGIGFMLIIAGVLIVLTAIFMRGVKPLRKLEKEIETVDINTACEC